MKKNHNTEVRRSRFWIFLAVMTTALLVLSGRLFLIQIVDRERYVEVAQRQQRVLLSGVDGRGVIYDRNLEPLTDAADDILYLISKNNLNSSAEQLLSKIGAVEMKRKDRRYAIYSTDEWHPEETERLKEEYGAFVMGTSRRYSDTQPAAHLIGYVNQVDGSGVCGLEKDYNELLSSSKKYIYTVGDGRGYILPGMGVHSTSGEDVGLVTTLDKKVQEEAERILRESGQDGAIVVSEAASGAILASASTPFYNPHRVEDYLKSGNQELLNKVTQSLYPPGSIFKIVVAAAALEQGSVTPDSTFFCPGYEEIDGIRIRCSAGGKKGHGTISFADGFAQSCNVVFIETGKKVGGDAIAEMARRFGLGETAIPGISGEKKGVVPDASDYQGAGIGNLSIGQGTLLITPVQANRMTKIVASGGVDTGLYLIKGTMQNGEVEEVSHQEARRVISPSTADTIKSLMRGTVLTGSANNITSDSAIHAAGKTGSAEAVLDGTPVIHAWFTGFFPVEAPHYVITVFIENGRSGRKAAVPLFEEMAVYLSKRDLR